MKQNERMLVYAVTGFLALILVVALVFSPQSGNNPLKTGTGAQGLDDILGNRPIAAEPKKEPAAPGLVGDKPGDSPAGLPSPKDVKPEQPLVAAAKPLTSADLVLQALGPSRVEHGVRFVRAVRNDTLEGLVKRWCGARDPFLAEAQALNEDLKMLRAGQEVAVPLVGDDNLLVAIEAQKPKTLMPEPSDNKAVAGAVEAMLAGAEKGKSLDSKALDGVVGNSVVGNNKGISAAPASAPAPRGATPLANGGKPDFASPGGSGSPSAKTGGEGGRLPAAAVGTAYTVKEKDSLWGIAAKAYGKKNADKMIPRIKDSNPGLAEVLRPGQKLVLPPADEPSKGGA
jgi:nucleoid-associated protein YgaU